MKCGSKRCHKAFVMLLTACSQPLWRHLLRLFKQSHYRRLARNLLLFCHFHNFVDALCDTRQWVNLSEPCKVTGKLKKSVQSAMQQEPSIHIATILLDHGICKHSIWVDKWAKNVNSSSLWPKKMLSATFCRGAHESEDYESHTQKK